MNCLDITNIPTAFLNIFLSMDHHHQNYLGVFVKFWIIRCLSGHTNLEFLYFQDLPWRLFWVLVSDNLLSRCICQFKRWCFSEIVERIGELFLIRLIWALWWPIWSLTPSSFKYSVGSLNYSLQNCHYFFNPEECFTPP